MNETPPALSTLPSAPLGHALRPHWALQEGMHFLNHGSYGATPRHVLEAEAAWRAQLEAQPVHFMGAVLPGALREAADRLAAFVGCAPQRLALVENATSGVNAVLRSLPWQPGDEVVVANHAYPAVRHTLQFVAERHGLVVRFAEVPFPLVLPPGRPKAKSGPLGAGARGSAPASAGGDGRKSAGLWPGHVQDGHEVPDVGALGSAQAIADAYCQAITGRTRLAIVDHVFSPLAVVTPLRPVVDHCRALGVPVLVDGAHAPGMLPLDLDALGAHWYTGNCHKWLFAPKGCAFLYASEAGAVGLHPAVISNFHGQGFPAEFGWQATRDYSGWLALPAALEFLQALGVQRYQQVLPALARDAAALLADRWGVEPPAPLDAFAAMVTLPLPGRPEASDAQARRWHDLLWQRHRIEVPVMCFNQRLWLRISAQVYNELSDYQALADAVLAELTGAATAASP